VKNLKHGVNPTLKQKMLIKQLGYVPANWLVVVDTPEEFHMANRTSGKVLKYRREGNVWIRKKNASVVAS
jgi:methionine salvage enolase-phosphatase E1